MAVDGAPVVALRETCRLVARAIPLWPYHRARLAAGGCGDALLGRAEDAALTAAREWTGAASSRVRLTVVVTPDGGVEAKAERRLSSLDVPGGPRLAVVEVAAPPRLPAGAAKPADRFYWDDAQRRARAAGGDIAALVGPDGAIIDAGTSTIWIVSGGAILTPPAPPAVAGVARAFLLDALAASGDPARVEALSADDLAGASEVFLTNAFGGAACVRGRGPGPASERVASIFDQMWRGRSATTGRGSQARPRLLL